MSTEKTSQQNANRDAWFVNSSINVSVPAEMGRDQLLQSLIDNRQTLEILKRDYYTNQKRSNSIEREKYSYVLARNS